MNNQSDNQTILLVEDEPLHLALYLSALKKLTNAQVLTAENEEQAMKLLTSVTPQLILLDLVIPAGGAGGREYSLHEPVGFEVLRSVKANPRTAHIPVVVFSNLDSDEHRRRAHELGAEDYIVKANLQPRELVDRIAKYLKT
jgi:putative two-component system response regulator